MKGWSRRQVLRACAAIGATSIAGCSGPGRDAADGNGTTGTETEAATTRTEATGENESEATAETTEATAARETPETVYTSEAVLVETMAKRLTVPWDLSFAPSGELYFTERPGRIGVLTGPGRVRTLATARDTNGGREGGLLGLTLHPDFPNPPSLYVYQTYLGSGSERYNRVLRYDRTATGLRRRGVVFDGIPGEMRHNGGRLAVGPDGKLYATTGDTTDRELARDRTSLAGKVLRLELDGSIPADNPFPGSPVWSYGHRNPQGIAWDPRTGQCLATEHGPMGHDELNGIEPGQNYGWPAVSGRAGTRFVAPLLESGESSWAPCGAAIYAGEAFPAWQGDLLFATLGYSAGNGRQSLHAVSIESGDGGNDREVVDHQVLLAGEFGRLRAVEEGPDGAIYVTTSNRDGRGEPVPTDDRILRLRPLE